MSTPVSRAWVPLLTGLLLLVAGCLGNADIEDEGELVQKDANATAPDPSPEEDEAGNRTRTSRNETAQQQDRQETNTTTGQGNQTPSEPEEPIDPGWPPIDEATVRPGVRVSVGNGTCTSNFVFQGPLNRSLYLGTAAHCAFDEEPLVGEPADIARGEASGTVAYVGWTVNAQPVGHDFALIEIDASDRDKVHPAVRHWRGPTGLSDPPSAGDEVLVYGNSTASPWAFVPELRPGRGVILVSQERSFRVVTALPGYLGDSGAPALSRGGQALGLLSYIETTVVGPTNLYTLLGPALEDVRAHGIDVSLATWPMSEEPLPPPPGPDIPP